MTFTLFFVIIVLFFWFCHILRRILFWLYIWQLKEYRFDRFLDGIKENKKNLFSKVSVFAFFLFLLSPLFLSVGLPFLSFGSSDMTIFEILVFVLYFFLGSYSLFAFFKRKWLFPNFTKKMIVLAGFTIVFGGLLVLFFLSFFFYFLLIFEILFPVYISVCVGLVQIPTFFAKKRIINKAKDKRREIQDLVVIGITGSYGKTSTKEFLSQILSLKYNVLKTEGNNNTEMGVAKTVLQKLTKKHEIFVCEMAAYKKGEIKAICDIVYPRIGILTGISQQHISLFGSLKNIENTKYELIESLPKNGLAIFNGFCKECFKLSKRCSLAKKIYAIPDGNVFAENILETENFIEFDMITPKGKARIRLNLLGRQNIENFLGAVVCAMALKITPAQIKKAAGGIHSPKILAQKKKGRNGVMIIDDSYSQNPDGVLAAIDHLKSYQGKKIILMPCLIELGKSAPSIHKGIGRKIGRICDLAVITSPYYFEELKLGAMETKMKENKILFSQNPKEILAKLEPYLCKDNVVLIEGRISGKVIKLLGKK